MKTADIQVTLIDHMGSDLSVVNAARVSFDKESDWEWKPNTTTRDMVPSLSEQDTKLINYLAKHNHKSPFNHAFLSFRVKAPIFVARQLVKHKFLPWNEVSRRYVDSEPEFYVPEVWRAKAENVKQGSSEEAVDSRTISKAIHVETCWDEPGNYDGRGYSYDSIFELSFEAYEELLRAGVCPEQARIVLPQNTMTEWIWSGSLGAFADMCKLRLDPHAQKESRDVAVQVAQHLTELFPVSWAALLNTKD
jgi:thymidylate synthase (FAD)